MYKALVLVVLVGAGLGALIPTGRPAPSAADPAPAAERGGRAVETRIPRQRNGHFYVDATVNGEHVRFLVDTGASFVALTAEDARRVGEPFHPSGFEEVGTGASGPVRGQYLTIDSIELQGKRVAGVRGAVIEGLDRSLLGQNFLARMGRIEITADEMVIHPAA